MTSELVTLLGGKENGSRSIRLLSSFQQNVSSLIFLLLWGGALRKAFQISDRNSGARGSGQADQTPGRFRGFDIPR
jgi:hypothetical protein